MAVTLDHLGELVSDDKDAKMSRDVCLETLRAISNEKLESPLSVKLTQLGLGLDIRQELCVENMAAIIDYASQYNIWVNIDMEDFRRCEAILEIFREVSSWYERVQTVIQAYLYRSKADVQWLADMGSNIRLVKGAYQEFSNVAYPKKADVDANYKQLMDIHLPSRGLTSIATHDEAMIAHAKEVIHKHSLSRHQYEFQMLYGIRHDLQATLVEEGYPLRIYVPYGAIGMGTLCGGLRSALPI